MALEALTWMLELKKQKGDKMAFKDKQRANEYVGDFLKKKYTQLSVNLENEKDKDILDYLDSIREKKEITVVDYIRQLIREDMRNSRIAGDDEYERRYKKLADELIDSHLKFVKDTMGEEAYNEFYKDKWMLSECKEDK